MSQGALPIFRGRGTNTGWPDSEKLAFSWMAARSLEGACRAYAWGALSGDAGLPMRFQRGKQADGTSAPPACVHTGRSY